jgi:hypothetical protein
MTHIDDAVPLDRDTNTQTTSPNWREKKFSGGSCPLKRQANLISDRKFIRSVWHVETERENGGKKQQQKRTRTRPEQEARWNNHKKKVASNGKIK